MHLTPCAQGLEGTKVELTVKKASGEVATLVGTRLQLGEAPAAAEDDRMSVVSAVSFAYSVGQKVRMPCSLPESFSSPFLETGFKTCPFESIRKITVFDHHWQKCNVFFTENLV
jgi:hypothetical protein